MIRLFPGMIVLDRYLVIAPPELAGAHGAIALARDHRLGGDVDLVFAPAPVGTPAGDLFSWRADKVAASQHPALPLILDRGLHAGHVVLVYRHGDGRLLVDIEAMGAVNWGHSRVPAPVRPGSAGYRHVTPPLSYPPMTRPRPHVAAVPPHRPRTPVAPRRVRGGLAPVAVGLAISLLPLAGALAHTAAVHAPFGGGPPWGQNGWDQGRHWRDWGQGQDAPWRHFVPGGPQSRAHWDWDQPDPGSR